MLPLSDRMIDNKYSILLKKLRGYFGTNTGAEKGY